MSICLYIYMVAHKFDVCLPCYQSGDGGVIPVSIALIKSLGNVISTFCMIVCVLSLLYSCLSSSLIELRQTLVCVIPL